MDCFHNNRYWTEIKEQSIKRLCGSDNYFLQTVFSVYNFHLMKNSATATPLKILFCGQTNFLLQKPLLVTIVKNIATLQDGNDF